MFSCSGHGRGLSLEPRGGPKAAHGIETQMCLAKQMLLPQGGSRSMRMVVKCRWERSCDRTTTARGEIIRFAESLSTGSNIVHRRTQINEQYLKLLVFTAMILVQAIVPFSDETRSGKEPSLTCQFSECWVHGWFRDRAGSLLRWSQETEQEV